MRLLLHHCAWHQPPDTGWRRWAARAGIRLSSGVCPTCRFWLRLYDGLERRVRRLEEARRDRAG